MCGNLNDDRSVGQGGSNVTSASGLLGSLDFWIIGLYFGAIFLFGLWFANRSHSAEDYFLAGRKSIWPIVGLSLFASNISGTTLVGLAGDAYATGISVYNYEWLAAVILAFFAIFVLPFVIRARVFTMPEYLERRYDKRARVYFSILTLFLTIVIDTAATLYAGGLLLKLFFPATPMWMTITALAMFAGAYTIAGGLAAVMYTDSVQALILLIGSTVISVIAYDAVGGWDAITAAVPAEKLSLIRPLDDPGVPWLGLVAGAPLLGFYVWCNNQFMVQRVLSAKSVEHGRWGALFGGLLKLPVLFLMVLPGTAAIILFPNLERPDMVYPTLLTHLLPTGLLGLVLAGFLAALMSQVTSTVNSAATLVTMDFIKPKWPDLKADRMVAVGRLVTLFILVAAILWAPQIGQFESLFKYLQKILTYAVTPTVALFLVGGFWRGANAYGARATLTIGTLAGAFLFWQIEFAGTFHLHFLYVAPLLFLLSCIVLVVASRLKPGTEVGDVDQYVWTVAGYRAESEALKTLPWWQNYRLHALLLTLVSTAIVISFW